MRRFIFALTLACLAGGVVLAQGGPPAPRPFGFAELWNNGAYYETNLEKKGFASLLARFEGKIGLNLFNLPLQAYGVYYGTASQSMDYWDNSLYYGGGVRLMPFQGFEATGWANEWLRDFKIFYEQLKSSYLQNASSAEAANLATEDTVYGLEVWHEWNLDEPNPNFPWGEFWTKLSYRKTDFNKENFNDYIFFFQPKIGCYLGKGIEPYLKTDITYSGKGGPDYYYLNIADYGAGIRFEPWRETGETNDLMRKFKMFVEVLGVSYLKDKPTDPNKQVSSDTRFGIDFSYGR